MHGDEVETRVRREMRLGQGLGPIMRDPVPLAPRFSRFRHVPAQPRRSLWARVFGRRPPQTCEAESPVASHAIITVQQIRLSREDDFIAARKQAFVQSLSMLRHPLAVEVIFGTRIILQMAGAPEDLAIAQRQLLTHFPHAEVFPAPDGLPPSAAIQVFCLRESHFFPIEVKPAADPTLSLFLEGIEQAVFQLLFMPLPDGFRDNILTAARDPLDPGKPFFADVPQVLKSVQAKAAVPLFAASLRIGAGHADALRSLAAYVRHFENADNGFKPMPARYPVQALAERAAYAPGMILNAAELAALLPLPGACVSCENLEQARKTAPPPLLARGSGVIRLGYNAHRGHRTLISIGADWLTRHVAIFGGTGVGKTTLLERFFEVIERGYGCAFSDSHGDAAKRALSFVPASRIADTIYADLADREFPLAFNLLQSLDGRASERLCSDLVVSLRRLSGAWGDQMEWIIRSATMTLLASPGEKTLRDLGRLLLDARYRAQVLATLDDPDLQHFWREQFPRLPKSALTPVVNRLSKFLDRPTIRNIICQPALLDDHRIVRRGNVLIGNLATGSLGEDVATFFGSVLLGRQQLAILSQAEIPPEERRPFVLIVDEFHAYADDAANVASLTSLFSEARKYGASLVVATQYLEQIHPKIRAAIFGNVGTLIVMRCSVADAKILQAELGSFTAEDILNLGVGEAIVRMGRSSDSFNLNITPRERPLQDFSAEIIARSRQRYCRPRAIVEEMIRSGGEGSAQGAAPQTSPQRVVQNSHPDRDMQEAGPVPHETRSAWTNDEIVLTDPDAKRLLRFIVEHPFRSIREIYAGLGLSAYKGDRVKGWLLQQELIQEYEGAGQRGRPPRIVIPSAKALALLGIPLPFGKGAEVHRFVCSAIARLAQEKGYRAELEKDGIDVLVTHGEQTIAVEVSVSTRPKDELENIRRSLSRGYRRIVIGFLDRAAMAGAAELLETDVLPEHRAAVTLCAINEVSKHLMF